jgi:hypothetical protein
MAMPAECKSDALTPEVIQRVSREPMGSFFWAFRTERMGEPNLRQPHNCHGSSSVRIAITPRFFACRCGISLRDDGHAASRFCSRVLDRGVCS